jgi:hypothetical protein
MTRRIVFVAVALGLASLAISAQSAAPIYDRGDPERARARWRWQPPSIRADVAISAGHFVKIGIVPGKDSARSTRVATTSRQVEST